MTTTKFIDFELNPQDKRTMTILFWPLKKTRNSSIKIYWVINAYVDIANADDFILKGGNSNSTCYKHMGLNINKLNQVKS